VDLRARWVRRLVRHVRDAWPLPALRGAVPGDMVSLVSSRLTAPRLVSGCRLTITPSLHALAPLVLMTVGCRTARPAIAPQYASRGEAVSAPGDDRPLWDVALAQGIPSLRSVQLAAGERELRIADSYSMVAGWPSGALRIVEARDGPSGEITFFWVESANWPRKYRATRCAPRAPSVSVCVYVVPAAAAPDWREVAAHLDSLDAWTISERCEDNRMIDDAGDLHLQRLDGRRFEEYRCNAPHYRRETAAAARAAALYEYFKAIVGRAGSPPRA
jgi:hypothetical protein